MTDRRMGTHPDTSPAASRNPESDARPAERPGQAALPPSGVQPQGQGYPVGHEHEGPATTRYTDGPPGHQHQPEAPAPAAPPAMVSPPNYVQPHQPAAVPHGYSQSAYPGAPQSAAYSQAPASDQGVYSAPPQAPSGSHPVYSPVPPSAEAEESGVPTPVAQQWQPQGSWTPAQAYPQQPSYPPQSGYPESGYPQSGYPQSGYPQQAGYPQHPAGPPAQQHPAQPSHASQPNLPAVTPGQVAQPTQPSHVSQPNLPAVTPGQVSQQSAPTARSHTPPPATLPKPPMSQRSPESIGPVSSLDKTIAPGDMGRRTISLTSPMGKTQVMHPEAELIPDSGARLIASGASTQSVQGAELHPEAPEWMRMGRLLALQIEDAIASNRGDAETRASIVRAWAAWQLGGHSRRQIKDISGNLMRAYKMAMQSSVDNRDAVLNDCAGVVYSTLPAFLRKSCDRNRVIVALQLMSEFEDAETARFEGLAVVLRWSDQARELGKQAVRCLLAEET